MADTLAFFALLSLLVACGGRQVREPMPDAELRSGPMLGFSEHRAVGVWAQTTSEAEVRIVYWPEGDEAARELSPPVRTSRADAYTAGIELDFLSPGTRYEYRVVLNGEELAAEHEQVFETAQLWRWRTSPPDFGVAFGSCHFVAEPEVDRPGDSWGSGYEIFDSIADAAPDLMLWIGDNIYMREPDWTTPTMIDHRYSHNREFGGADRLMASTHNYAIWDDHDFGPNNSDRTFPLKGEALESFARFWMNPSYGLPELPGAFTRFVYGDAEFFFVDVRYWRAPDDADLADSPMLGDAQLDWLLDSLTTSTATFKVVVGGSQLINDAGFYEGWVRHPEERERFYDELVRREIEGVILLSGDRHHAELLRTDLPGFYPLFELTSSPLTAGVGDARHELDNPQRVGDSLVLERNFGMLEFEGPEEDRRVVLSLRDTDGSVLFSHTISAAELSLPDAP